MSYSFRAPTYIPRVERVTNRQLKAIYALQKRLSVKLTWDTKMSKRRAQDLISSLRDQLSRQASLF